MVYNVLDTFPIGENTSVTIEGNGDGLKNNMIVASEDGSNYKLLSVAMLSGNSSEDRKKSTTLLIEGRFDSKIIKL